VIVYKITNTTNGKVYIGQTTKPEIEVRWKQHVWFSQARNQRAYKSALQNAIRKYGAHSFIIEPLYHAKTRKELNAMETFFITLHQSHKSENGYNMTLKTTPIGYWAGKKRSPETIEKMRQSALSRGIGGWDQSPEAIKSRVATRRARGNYGVHRIGKHDSLETINRKRESMLAHSINWPSQLELQEMVSRTSKRAVGRLLGVSATSVSRHLTTKMDFRSHNQRRFLGSFQ